MYLKDGASHGEQVAHPTCHNLCRTSALRAPYASNMVLIRGYGIWYEQISALEPPLLAICKMALTSALPTLVTTCN